MPTLTGHDPDFHASQGGNALGAQHINQRAIEYIMDIERSDRAQVPPEELVKVDRQAIEYAVISRELEMADAFRVLAYVRWACAEKLPGFTLEVQQIDHLLSTMEVNGHHDPAGAARERANTLRNELEPVLNLP